MKHSVFPILAIILAGSALFVRCSSDAVTDSLNVQFGPVEISTEASGGSKVLNGKISVTLVNRTEKQINIGFLEGVITDAKSGDALIRFRPIIPDAYGSISTVRLLPKEVKDIPVVLPLGLQAFDPAAHPSVTVGLSFQTTDGYRTTVNSNAVMVSSK